MIVTAPGLRWEPSKGVYCFTLRYNVSSGLSSKALRYSRMYCPSTACSFMRKFNVDIVATKLGRRIERMGYMYRPEDKRTLYNEELPGINIWTASYLSTFTLMISRDLVILPLCNCWFNKMWLLKRLVVYFMTKMVGIGPHVFGCVIYFSDLEGEKDVVLRQYCHKQ